MARYSPKKLNVFVIVFYQIANIVNDKKTTYCLFVTKCELPADIYGLDSQDGVIEK